MSNVRVCGPIVIAAVASVIISTGAEAQRLALTYSVFPTTPTTTELLNLATGMVEFREQRSTNGPGLFSADGRFFLQWVLLGGSPALEVRDLGTGFRTSIATTFQPRHAHPRRLAVFGLVAGVVTRLEPAGFRSYTACAGSSASGIELTVDGSRLLVQCASGVIESLDEATGTRLSAFIATSIPSFSMAVNGDGSRAVVARRNTPDSSQLVLFDVANGTELLAVPVPGGPPPAPFSGPGSGAVVAVTPSRDAVIVTNFWSFDPGPGAPLIFYRKTYLVDFDTLVPRAELAVPYNVNSLTISPNGQRAIVASNDIRPGAALQDFDLRTGQPTAQFNILNGFASVGGVFPPLPPTLPPPTVSGQRVTISWSLPGHSPPADRFVLRAGSRSGASDLGTLEFGPGVRSFTANGVPPGRYFIRMTAVNFTGTSVPSSELIVDVP